MLKNANNMTAVIFAVMAAVAVITCFFSDSEHGEGQELMTTQTMAVTWVIQLVHNLQPNNKCNYSRIKWNRGNKLREKSAGQWVICGRIKYSRLINQLSSALILIN